MIYSTGQNKKSWEPDRRAALFALFVWALEPPGGEGTKLGRV